ncbi:MAG TPA: ATP-binding protein [Terriglobales bacterium]|nr:ATP-binding protein [Terriglobales bacterium]
MDARPIRLLLVDDDEDDYLITRNLLSATGGSFRLDWVASYDSALEVIGLNEHDCYLIDYRLGDRNGLELLRHALASGCKVPTILLTGQGDRDVDIAAMKAGAADYLVKGQIDPPLLERSIRYAIERHRGEQEVQLQMGRLSALNEIGVAITSTLELRTILDNLTEKIDLFLPHSSITTIRLFNKKTKELEFVSCRNIPLEEMKGYCQNSQRGLAEIVFESKAPLAISDVRVDPRTRDPLFFERHGLVSYLGVPLIAKDKVVGVLSFIAKENHDFNNQEINFLKTLASQAAIAIYNSQLYEQIRDQAAALTKANKVKDEFLSVISHELRTPIVVIMGYTRMVQEGMLGNINPEQTNALEKVTKNSDELLAMVNSIMEAIKVESGLAKGKRHPCDLGHFFDEIRSSYSFSLGKELILKWEYLTELPVIHTDGAKLKCILQNLISNAIKFTDKGEVTVSARHILESGTVEIAVTDTGIGIPKESLPFIFDRFWQNDGSPQRRYSGVGLGLYIVKKFTDLLGGKIEVESALGNGSTFTLKLPINYQAQYDFLSPTPFQNRHTSRERSGCEKSGCEQVGERRSQNSCGPT